jgi:hypothetical protein
VVTVGAAGAVLADHDGSWSVPADLTLAGAQASFPSAAQLGIGRLHRRG